MQVEPRQLDLKSNNIYLIVENVQNDKKIIYAFLTYDSALQYSCENREIVGPIPIMDMGSPLPILDPITLNYFTIKPSFDPFSEENKAHPQKPKPLFKSFSAENKAYPHKPQPLFNPFPESDKFDPWKVKVSFDSISQENTPEPIFRLQKNIM